MKTPTTQTRHFKSIISRLMLALAFASVISAMALAPVLADDHDNRQGNWNNGRGNGKYNNGNGKGHDYHGERHAYQQPYYYNQRPPPHNAYRYVPPPIYYPPVPSPGINLVFPIGIH
jgi:hypothetical protein